MSKTESMISWLTLEFLDSNIQEQYVQDTNIAKGSIYYLVSVSLIAFSAFKIYLELTQFQNIVLFAIDAGTKTSFTPRATFS